MINLNEIKNMTSEEIDVEFMRLKKIYARELVQARKEFLLDPDGCYNNMIEV